MKKYIKPQTTVLTIESRPLMQTGSNIDGFIIDEPTDTQLTKEDENIDFGTGDGW